MERTATPRDTAITEHDGYRYQHLYLLRGSAQKYLDRGLTIENAGQRLRHVALIAGIFGLVNILGALFLSLLQIIDTISTVMPTDNPFLSTARWLITVGIATGALGVVLLVIAYVKENQTEAKLDALDEDIGLSSPIVLPPRAPTRAIEETLANITPAVRDRFLALMDDGREDVVDAAMSTLVREARAQWAQENARAVKEAESLALQALGRTF